ncbi:MAG: hypothetical protein P1U71_00030 [Sneathiella sp.]|nr:hypothetical protein [Sneathiella sp.]MDF2365626.1 hypothetical protein [Sneathiella sp.]
MVDILSRRCFRLFLQALLNLFKGFKADQPFMFTFTQADIPIGHFDISSIDNTSQKIRDPLVPYFAVRQVLRKSGLGLQKTLYLGLGLKTSGSKALQRFLQGRGIWLVADQKFAMPANALVPVTDRGLKHPISVLGSGPHPVDCLLTVLLALVL